MSRADPQSLPEWHFIQRETMLVRQLVGSGATALGKADYAKNKGEYYNAFFGLSVGLERLCKLILVVDHALTHSGALPTEVVVRKFGHKIGELFNAVEGIAKSRGLSYAKDRPNNKIVMAMLSNLDAFADAGRGRYANFAALTDPTQVRNDPLAKWWNEVAEAVLLRHYYGTKKQEKVEANAQAVSAIGSSFTYVQYTTETRDQLTDLELASRRTGQLSVVQPWSRYHALTLVRWLAYIHQQLTKHACYNEGIDAFFGCWEFLDCYRLDDSFLKSRKIWPLD